jgi:hypothetical protein
LVGVATAFVAACADRPTAARLREMAMARMAVIGCMLLLQVCG